MKTVIFVLPGNVETQPTEVCDDFNAPHYSIRNEINGSELKIWLPGSTPPATEQGVE